MNISIPYLVLIGRSVDCLIDLLDDREALEAFTRSHNFAADFELLLATIEERPEAEVMGLAIREYQFALYAIAAAKYRHATISLRLFFELSLSSIHFSANEFHLREWQVKKRDINWNALTDPSDGVFAHNFIEAFNPGMERLGKQYATLAGTVYRECSEYVHGNRHTYNLSDTDQSIRFERDQLINWAARADTIRLCILFAFACRYLRLIGKPQRIKLEHLMLDSFGTISTVRDFYAAG
ncbi:hypothetical protein [Bradyrhizobium sp. HKCCYLS3013]|uniref:hypothetical protein n=1 Tax=Bradyrhizobium sp. HKCCYLS3013 TaxID=3420735 RepID=UPI003EBF43ED